MNLTIELFAGIAEAVGKNQVEISLSETASCEELRACFIERFPQTAALLKVSRIAINGQYADEETNGFLSAGDEVAILPPVSGG